ILFFIIFGFNYLKDIYTCYNCSFIGFINLNKIEYRNDDTTIIIKIGIPENSYHCIEYRLLIYFNQSPKENIIELSDQIKMNYGDGEYLFNDYTDPQQLYDVLINNEKLIQDVSKRI